MAIQVQKAFSSRQKLKDKVRRALEFAKTSTSCKMWDEFACKVVTVSCGYLNEKL